MKKINSFRGQYEFLSNFYPCSIEVDGIVYPSVEHAFQALKTFDVLERKRIASLATPGQAKRAGRRVKLRSDWNKVRIKVMHDLLTIKFSDPSLKKLLIATGNAELEEGNTWNDTFWGVCNGVGDNILGLLLMRVRREKGGA